MTLAALLEELRGADPEQSEKLQCWIDCIREVIDLELPSECYLVQAMIQHSIQRACERRGWTLTLEYVMWYSPMRRWHAYISTGPRSCDTKDTASDSAAEALLAAYIAAVREETKR
jgi:hypothetical protein